jgi:hypothetical protein
MGHRQPSPATLRRFGSIEPKGRGVILPGYHPAVRGATTMFPTRVFDPSEVARVLKSGHQSRKIGAMVTKGARRGWPIFTLTLEERASCPRTCTEWQHCYGNNMQAAERIVHGEALIAALAVELAALGAVHPRGFMVRLHVLGDFYSADYVDFWRAQLAAHSALHLFGFTANAPSSAIGRQISLMALNYGWHRAAIRFSGAPHELRAARVIEAGEHDVDDVLCPAQTGATECCATCALCWNSERSIAFRRH